MTRPPEPAHTALRRAGRTETERTRAETALLYAMLCSKEAALLVCERGCEGVFSGEAYRAFAGAVAAAYKRGEAPNAALIVAGMSKGDAEQVSLVLREEIERDEPLKAAEDCLRRIEQCELAGEIDEIKRALTEPSLTAEQRTRKLRDMQRLNLRMRGL